MVGSRHNKEWGYTNWIYQFTVWIYQLISEPTHILQNSSFCIDLIFTDQPHLVINNRLNRNFMRMSYHICQIITSWECHITYAKFNQQTMYPQPYQRLAWDYIYANASSVQIALNMIDWSKLFSSANVETRQIYWLTIYLIYFPTFLEVKSLQFMAKIHHGQMKRLNAK